jgi:hypothetical protein
MCTQETMGAIAVRRVQFDCGFCSEEGLFRNVIVAEPTDSDVRVKGVGIKSHRSGAPWRCVTEAVVSVGGTPLYRGYHVRHDTGNFELISMLLIDTFTT